MKVTTKRFNWKPSFPIIRRQKKGEFRFPSMEVQRGPTIGWRAGTFHHPSRYDHNCPFHYPEEVTYSVPFVDDTKEARFVCFNELTNGRKK